MSSIYLLSICIPGLCMLLVDHRWKLFAFRRPLHAVVTLLVGFVFFLAWDIVAIELGVYVRGESDAMTGVEVAPELPLEEIVFVTFLCYVTLVTRGLVAHAVAGLGAPARTEVGA